MKNLMHYFIMIFLMAIAISCDTMEDRDTLGDPISPSSLEFSVTQDTDKPNILYLNSSTPGVIPFWDYVTGVSNKANDEVLIPFEGEYWIKYYAYSGGGPTVDSATVTLEQDEEYFSDPRWNLLTDGATGKTWVWARDNPKGKVVGIGSYDAANWDPFKGFEWWSSNADGDIELGEFTLDLNKGFNFLKDSQRTGVSKGLFKFEPETGYIQFQGTKMLSQEGDNTQSSYRIAKLTEDEFIICQIYDWGGQRTYYFKRKGYVFPV
jgi:hypothetical protein